MSTRQIGHSCKFEISEAWTCCRAAQLQLNTSFSECSVLTITCLRTRSTAVWVQETIITLKYSGRWPSSISLELMRCKCQLLRAHRGLPWDVGRGTLFQSSCGTSASEVKTLWRYTNLFIIIIIFLFWPRYSIPEERKNYAMQYEKVQKSSWNEPFLVIVIV